MSEPVEPEVTESPTLDETNDTGHDKMTIDDLHASHRKERKDLLAQIQKIKRDVKGDKRLKKDSVEKITKLETELNARHEDELRQFRQRDAPNDAATIADAVGDLQIESSDKTDSVTSQTAPQTNQNADQSVPDTGQTTMTAVDKKKAKKQEKAQKKRDKRKEENIQREERIKHQEIENLKGERHLEQQKLKAKLAERGLQIHEVPSDGNCLYNAISHQLRQGLSDCHNTNETLRHQTADYMLSHCDDFLPFMSKPNTDDLYTYDEFEKYCTDIKSTSCWGGQLELKALSSILRCPIEVVQADCSAILIGSEQTSSPLIVVYHRHVYSLGEHYNSVLPLTQDTNDDDDFIEKR